MGKGSAPRPLGVSPETFSDNFDLIFGNKVAKTQCGCYNCMNEIKDARGWPLTMSTFIVCPDCGNKRCPKSTDHNLACTNSNDPGQPGSRYQ
jgi:hypothetical protein